MSGIDAHVQATDPLVIDGLQYKLKPNGQYVTSRQSVSFHPSGSNIYTPVGGTRVMRIVLSDSAGAWLSPESVKLQFDVVNKESDAAKRLRPLTPWGFFKKMRITCGGSLVEDFDYNRTHEMFHMMKPADIRDNDTTEGFEYREGTIIDPNPANMAGIAGNTRKTVCFSLLSGLLQCGKMLPLSYMKGGLVIELELVNSFAEPLVDTSGATFTSANTSVNWNLENCQIKADILHLDNGFQNSYDSHMLDGGLLAINFQGYITSQQSIVGDKVTVNLSRQASHLKGVFVSFDKSSKHTETYKEWNLYYHPMKNSTPVTYTRTNADGTTTDFTNNDPYEQGREIEWQLQIGGKTYPQMPVNSIAESYSQLRKAVARYGKHPISITPQQYHSSKFVAGLDLEMLPEVGYTGISTKNGEMLTFKLKAVDINALNAGALVADGNTQMPDQLFMVLCTDNILELKDSGVSVLD